MTFWKSALLVLSLALPAGLPLSAVHAQELSDSAREAMTTRIDAFNETVAGGDMGAVFDYMPPKILSLLATQSGLAQEELIAASKAQIELAMATVTIDSFSMDIDAATYQLTPDGSRGYVLIPTETVMTVEGAGGIRATSETLAFEDEGEWYVARIDEPTQAQLLQTAYPEFVGVEFKPGTMEPVE
ncbi:MAG: hypothetical protein HC844_04525 [Tabrizicola sp.]|nr:hypothetical protein [Tabrizicola sp.]